MKDLRTLDRFRIGDEGDHGNGAFLVPQVRHGMHRGARLKVIASNGGGWDHVSVSLPSRCPTWPEMSYIKGLFFRPDEVVMQLHVAEDAHINCHPYCLHLWRPQEATIPTPPGWMVGLKGSSR